MWVKWVSGMWDLLTIYEKVKCDFYCVSQQNSKNVTLIIGFLHQNSKNMTLTKGVT